MQNLKPLPMQYKWRAYGNTPQKPQQEVQEEKLP